MSKIVIVILALAILLAAGYFIYQSQIGPVTTGGGETGAGEINGGTANAEQDCVSSGGVPAVAMCCKEKSDFPDTCDVNTCGCTPGNSKETKVCECGPEKCFDGTQCQPLAGPAVGEVCSDPSGVSMDFNEAQQIAAAGPCSQEGVLQASYFCNANTGTWWIDLAPTTVQEGCSPACVVKIADKTSEVNWRCTGLQVP